MPNDLTPARLAGLERIASAPMAMRPESLRILSARIIAMDEFEEPPSLEATIVERAPQAAEAKVPKLPKVKGGVAVVPIFGGIGQHRGGDYWASVYSEELTSLTAQLIDMPNIGAVVYSVDSPGGIVYGVGEAAMRIREMSAAKPIYTHVKGMSASAAYWLSAATTKIFSNPSAEAGSIGVWTMHVDVSEAWKKIGVDIKLISAGKYKTEGHPFGPLEDEARAEMQRSVDYYYGEFLRGVADGRGVSKATVKSEFGEGRMMEADRAKAAGLIDGIATLDELLAGLIQPPVGGIGRRSQASRLAIAEAEDNPA